MFVLAFVIFYALSQSSRTTTIYISGNVQDAEVLKNLLDEGILRGDFSYHVLNLLVTLNGGIKPGGYNLKTNSGAVTTFLDLKKPDILLAKDLEKAEKIDLPNDCLFYTRDKYGNIHCSKNIDFYKKIQTWYRN